MEPAPYTTAVLFFRISSISIMPFALVGRRPNLSLSSRTRLADLYPSCQKQYTIGVNHAFRRIILRCSLMLAYYRDRTNLHREFESFRKETFDPREYIQWVHAFETQHAHAEGGGAIEHAIRSSWVAHQSTIHMVLTSLEKLAGVLRSRTLPSVICHGDLHARNLIRDRADRVF